MLIELHVFNAMASFRFVEEASYSAVLEFSVLIYSPKTTSVTL